VGKMKSPSSLEVAVRALPVRSSARLTLAPAITLPELSTIVPAIVPVTDWAMASPYRNVAQNRQDSSFDQCNLVEDIRTSSVVYWKAQHKGSKVHRRTGACFISSRHL